MLEDQNIFSPVQTERVSRLIEDQIKEAIIKGHYKVGDKLPSERDLAEMFLSSRTSIREALRSLEKSGFLVIKKGVQGGAFVIKGDSKQLVNSIRDMLRLRQVSLEEILAARLAIEPSVASEAARKAAAEGIGRLEEVVRNLEEEFSSENPIIEYERSPTFHNALAEVSGNQVFVMVMQVLMEIHSYRMSQFKLDQGTKREIVRQHKGIIESIKTRREDEAFERMRKHVLDVHKMHKRLEERAKT